MSDEQNPTETTVEKAAVTLPPPGTNVRFALLGTDFPENDIVSYDKPVQYGIYYEMYRQHPYVRAAVDKVASFAVKAGYHFVPEDPEEQLDEAKVRKLKRFFRISNATQLLRMTYKDLQIYGESFWLIEKNLAKTPYRAVRLIPRFMRPRTAGGKLTGWSYGQVNSKDRVRRYDVKEVIHFRVDDTEDDLIGLSPLHSLQRTVAGDINAMEYNGNYFENGAQTGIVFSMQNSNADEAKRNREYLEQQYVGVRNAHRPMVLEGEVSVEKATVNQTDMEFVAYRQMNRQEILAVTGVDPTKLGINEDANRSTAKEAEDTFHNETVATWQQLVEDEVNNSLILGVMEINDTLFKHSDTDPRTQAQNLKNFKEAEIGGIMNVNEIRSKLGYGPVKGGDVHFIQTAAGLIPLSMVEEIAKRLVLDNTVGARPGTGLGTNDNPPNAPIEDADEDEDD